MEPVRFAISRRQARGFLAVIVGLLLLVDAIMIYVMVTAAKTPGSLSTADGVLFMAGLDVLLLAITLPIYVLYAVGWTELSLSGIRTRRLGRTRAIAWDQVHEIGVRTRNGASEIVVTGAGFRVALGAPANNMVAPNRRFSEEVGQIRDYWRAAAAHPR